MQLLLSERPNKRTICQQATIEIKPLITPLFCVHTTYIWVQFFAHIPFVVNHAFNVTPRSGNKTIHCKIFAQTGFLPKKVQLKLMSHLQQLFTLHWYRRLRCNNDYSTYQHGRQMNFSMEWPKNCSRGPTGVNFDFIDSKLRERHFLTKNLMNNYKITTSTGLSSLPFVKIMHTSTL